MGADIYYRRKCLEYFGSVARGVYTRVVEVERAHERTLVPK